MNSITHRNPEFIFRVVRSYFLQSRLLLALLRKYSRTSERTDEHRAQQDPGRTQRKLLPIGHEGLRGGKISFTANLRTILAQACEVKRTKSQFLGIAFRRWPLRARSCNNSASNFSSRKALCSTHGTTFPPVPKSRAIFRRLSKFRSAPTSN